MKYDLQYLSIDITVEDALLDHPDNLCGVMSVRLDAKTNPLYWHCKNIREIEQAFERHHNHPTNDDAVLWPKQKVKVLKVVPQTAG
ncbi:hypothetical protein IFT69_26560 [Pseudomonas putida]|nr:hypothetical protein [Pseudomonas putida]